MRVSLTGATGFVGSHTVKLLAERGHQIRAFVRPARDVRWLEALGAEICRGEMADEMALRELVAGAEVLIHTAYDHGVSDDSNQLPYLRSNIFGTLTLLELARLAGVGQFICTASTYLLRPDVSTPADVCHVHIDEHSPWMSAWNTYVMHNTVLESACQTYYSQFGLSTTRFRCAGIYGLHPNLQRTVWRDIMEAIKAGQKYESRFGCDVVAIQDVAMALTAAVGNSKASGEVFNLCDMFVYNQEVAQLARAITGSQAEVAAYDLPNPAAISSEKVKVLGVDVHRGISGIHAYLEELNGLIS